jgi:hypothetical protein
MSYTSIQTAVRDTALQDRVTAGAMKEAIAGGPEFKDSAFGGQLRSNPILAVNTFMWPVCIDYEAEYEYALDGENPDPGGDPGVITDAMIGSAIQTHWPEDPANLPADLIEDPTTKPAP